jgi:hypothetical protein
MMALELRLVTIMTSCCTVLFITVNGSSYTQMILSESLEALEILTFGCFLIGLFSMGIFLNSLIAITVTSAPVLNSQVEVGPWIVFTVICSPLTRLLSRLANDVFSAIFHVHILTIISMFNDPKGFFLGCSVQLSLGAAEELEPSFLT